MNKRPLSISVISWVFIGFGGIALLTGLLPKLPGANEQITDFSAQHPVQYALLFVGPVLAVVCGAFMLRGCNWARWLLVVWFGCSVIDNILHSPMRLLWPGLLFGVAVFFLFRPQATAYFRGTDLAQITQIDDARMG